MLFIFSDSNFGAENLVSILFSLFCLTFYTMVVVIMVS